MGAPGIFGVTREVGVVSAKRALKLGAGLLEASCGFQPDSVRLLLELRAGLLEGIAGLITSSDGRTRVLKAGLLGGMGGMGGLVSKSTGRRNEFVIEPLDVGRGLTGSPDGGLCEPKLGLLD